MPYRSLAALAAVTLGLVAGSPTPAPAGEALPPGPPWHASWPQARRQALRTGRPIFAYFTKRH